MRGVGLSKCGGFTSSSSSLLKPQADVEEDRKIDLNKEGGDTVEKEIIVEETVEEEMTGEDKDAGLVPPLIGPGTDDWDTGSFAVYSGTSADSSLEWMPRLLGADEYSADSSAESTLISRWRTAYRRRRTVAAANSLSGTSFSSAPPSLRSRTVASSDRGFIE